MHVSSLQTPKSRSDSRVLMGIITPRPAIPAGHKCGYTVVYCVFKGAKLYRLPISVTAVALFPTW
jgi:hypothetical protein